MKGRSEREGEKEEKTNKGKREEERGRRRLPCRERTREVQSAQIVRRETKGGGDSSLLTNRKIVQ